MITAKRTVNKSKYGAIQLGVAISLILIALVLALIEWRNYRNSALLLPEGSHWGEVDVSGLTLEQAEQKVTQIFHSPVELRYRDQRIQTSVEMLGYQLNLAQGRIQWQEFNEQAGYWDYLWRRPQPPVSLDLEVALDENSARQFLSQQIAARYDDPPEVRLPVPGTTRFTNDDRGYSLDVASSLRQIIEFHPLSDSRFVELVVLEGQPSPVDATMLQAILVQHIQLSGFNGIAEIYIQDLKNNRVVHFAMRAGEIITPEIAFSAASTIKIPILVSALLRAPQPIEEDLKSLAERMMILSENPPADALMERAIGSTLAPLKVSEDLQKMGFANTFLAGYFYLGAPLLQRFDTPANTRSDVDLRPDVYNQTTPADMGRLLAEMYRCAKNSAGLLIETFNEQINAEKCQLMLDVMLRNNIGVLIEAGIPEGTPIARKHGWTEEGDGFLRTISDAGIVFAPQTDYVQVIFLHDPLQLLFEPGNALMAQLSQVVFNAFNPDYQIDWMFGEIRYR